MKRTIFHLSLCLLTLFTVNIVNAKFPNPITLSTGQGAPGTQDPIWQCSPWSSTVPGNPMGLTYGPTLINYNCAPGAWVTPSALPAPMNNGNWITGTESNCATNTNAGYRYFRLTLNLPPNCNGFSVTEKGNYILSFEGYVDNYIHDVFINGNSQGISGGSFSTGSQLSIYLDGPWVVGTNYIDILVYNTPSSPPGSQNPYGLLLVANGTYSAGMDQDNDGISDLDDLCPCDAGVAPHGCQVPSPNTCDIDLIRSAFLAAGCIELPLCYSDCSIYFLNPQSMSGSQAQAFAQTLGANLISVQDAAENQCIIDELNRIGESGVIWIGFNDEEQEGNFAWYDQTPITYTNWAPGEPNNSGGNEDCVQIYPDGMWNDLNCNTANAKSIIEVNLCPAVLAQDVIVCENETTIVAADEPILGSHPYTFSWNNGVITQSQTVPTIDTEYVVMVTDRYNCSGSDTVKVITKPVPVASVYPIDTLICSGEQTAFDIASTINGTTFEWTATPTDVNGSANGNGHAISQMLTTSTSSNGSVNYIITPSYDGCVGDPINASVTVSAVTNLTFSPASVTICEGDTQLITVSGANTYSWSPNVGLDTTTGAKVEATPISTQTYVVIGANADGCESTNQVVVTVNPLPTVDAGQDVTICSGNSVTLTVSGAVNYDWSGESNSNPTHTVSPTTTTIYSVTGTDANGCINTDSVMVKVHDTIIVNDELTICASELPYQFGTKTFLGSGIQTEIFQTINGCDSTVTLNLQVNDTFIINDAVTICASELPYQFGTKTFVEAGIQTEIFQTVNGCDSTVTLNLQVKDSFIVNDAVTICASELPYQFGIKTFLEAGIQTDIFQTINGCDSIVTLNLQVHDTFIVNDTITICASELPYQFGTKTFLEAGTQTEIFQTINGCDSTITLRLNVLDTFMHSDWISLCSSELPFAYGSRMINGIGIYREVFSTVEGCDSTVVLTISLKDTFNINDSVVVCPSDLPFRFGNKEIAASGLYTESFTSIAGCDSTVHLYLQVKEPQTFYVAQTSKGRGDGTTWDHACSDLQEMISRSCSGDTIFVAEGVYYPVRPVYELGEIDKDNPDNSFVLKEGVKIYGGFSGNELSLSARKLLADHRSILSGDLDRSGTLTTGDVYHVVIGYDLSESTVLDGFRIVGGNASSSGTTSFKNSNIEQYQGGGIYLYNSSALFDHLEVSGNRAYYGGGIYGTGSSVLLTNSVLSGNFAYYSGGGYYNNFSTPRLINTTIASNYSDKGGGIFNNANASISLTNSIIYGNNSGLDGNGSHIISYSIVQNMHGGNNGNLSSDPLFVDALPAFSAPTVSGNYRLQSCSPGIDAGLNDSLRTYQLTDISGGDRILNGFVDMGAYENAGFVLHDLSSSTLLASSSCEDKDGWIHFYNDKEDALILSIHPREQDLGQLHVTSRLEPGYGTGSVQELLHPFAQNGYYYPFNRSWIVESEHTLNEAVHVRYYFSAKDSMDISSVNMFGTLLDLILYKVSGDNAWDPSSLDYREYTYSDSSSLQHYTYGMYHELRYAEFEVEDFSTGVLALKSGIPLSLSSLTFKGRVLESNDVQLEWTTEGGDKLRHFDVERSVDGRGWHSIGRVWSVNSDDHLYTFLDSSAYTGFNFYRLRVVDQPGGVTYSDIVLVKIGNMNTLQIELYPNPNRGHFTLLVEGLKEEGSTMDVTDLLGRKMHSQEIINGRNEIRLSNVSAGVYSLVIRDNYGLRTLKVIVDY